MALMNELMTNTGWERKVEIAAMIVSILAAPYMFLVPVREWSIIEWVALSAVCMSMAMLNLRDLVRKFGFGAVVVKAAVFIDGLIVTLFIVFGGDPLTNIFIRHLPAREGYWLPICSIALGWLVTSERLTPWFIEHGKWFVIPATIVTIMMAWVIYNGGFEKTFEKYPPQNSVITPSVLYASDGLTLEPQEHLKTDFQKWLDTSQGKSVLHLAMFVWVLLFVVTAAMGDSWKRNRISKKLHRRAIPIVHGASRLASKQDARRKGWI